jgi:hypothetical protein
VKWFVHVYKDLITPDDQKDDWYGWASNQLSHAFFGVLVAILSGPLWLWVALGISSIKEGFDIYKSPKWRTALDSAIDIIFWVGGAAILKLGNDGFFVFLGLTLILLLGIRKRIKVT